MFLMGDGEWSPEHVVDMNESIDQSIGSQESHLERTMEVDCWVVRHERCTEVHVPRHILKL